MNKGFLLLDALFIVIVSSFSVLLVSQVAKTKQVFNMLKNEWYEEIENRRLQQLWKIEPIIITEDLSSSPPLS